jgi:hypothetical protein
LCEAHHVGFLYTDPKEPRVIAFHGGERTFIARYGNEIELLEVVWERLGMDIQTLPSLSGKIPPWWVPFKEGRLATTSDLNARMILTGPIYEFEEEDI